VLIKADGQVLYTLASVVDDIEMGVTHIVRGSDHVTNTATQIQIIRALGGTPPAFAHHSLLTGRRARRCPSASARSRCATCARAASSRWRSCR
jgi:glutamyl/glutaminyl-tRNA synthetase